MKSDAITIDNKGAGFREAVEETKKVAAFRGLNHQDSIQLQLLTEEMLSMARSVTGEMCATFWLESEGPQFDLHMTTKTVMDAEKRRQLISASSSRKNDAATSFLGKLRDIFEEALVSEVDYSYNEIPADIQADLANHPIADTEWDGYEKSILRRVADDIKIAIRGGEVEMIVSKKF